MLAKTIHPRLARLAGANGRRLAHKIAAPLSGFDFDALTFGLNGVSTEFMWVSQFDHSTGKWDNGGLQPRGPLSLDPASTVLNYGQSIFEGLKAFRHANGDVNLFRPDRNAARMREGAERMMLPEVPEELFLKARCASCHSTTHHTP